MVARALAKGGRAPGCGLPFRRWASASVLLAALFLFLSCTQVAWGSRSAASAAVTAGQSVAAVPRLTTGPYEANIIGGSSNSDCAPSTPPTATADPSLDSVFAAQQGPGWIGGDATYSTALPNQREAFVFSDTLLGTALSNGRASLTGLAHNSELTGTLPDLGLDVNGTESSPTLIPDQDSPGDSWQVASTYMENGEQLVFVNEFSPVPGSLFDNFTGRTGIAVMSLASGAPTLVSVASVPTDPITQWGNAMTQSDGYDYIYGLSMNTATNTFYGLKVGRVPVGDSLEFGDWTYWTGSTWSSGETNAIVVRGLPLITGIVPLQNRTGFMGVGISGLAGHAMKVVLTFSCSPTGPWSAPQVVYTIPETTEYPNEYAYIATFHPELRGDGVITSYNVDSLNGFSALVQNNHQYQPSFVQITSSTLGDPPVSLPEVPAPLLLPLSALALAGVVYGINRRPDRGRRRRAQNTVP
jgi:hypothetical protein